MKWAILVYEVGRHQAIQNSLARVGILSVVPLVEEYSELAKKRVLRPALPKLLFLEADEQKCLLALERIRYAEKVWRDSHGDLAAIPDNEFQFFLDGLDRRQKKAKKMGRGFHLGDAAQVDWFNLYAKHYGQQMAVKRFGRDLREPEVA